MNKFFLLCFVFLYSELFYAQKYEEWTIPVKGGQLAAEHSIPADSKSSCIVLFIAGSGPTDRDGNNAMMKNNSLKMLSDSLVSNGIATLRIDKRGVGSSKFENLDEAEMTIDTLVKDVVLWIDKLKKYDKYKRIFVLGHSEGSLIGILAIQRSNGVNGLISVAGVASSADEIIKTQLKYQPAVVQFQAEMYLNKLKEGTLIDTVESGYEALFRKSVQPYMISWIKYNPMNEIAKLKIPILVLQGKNDLQVSVEESTKLASANKRIKLVLLENTNHILKIVQDVIQNQNSYNDPSFKLNREVPKEINTFIKQN